MKRKKYKHFKKHKDFLTFWLKNVLKRKPPAVEESKPENPADRNWRRYWMFRGLK